MLALPPVGTEPKIHYMRQPALPQFVFEWHAHTEKVYVVGIPGRWIDRTFVPAISGEAKGFVLAEHCDTHGRFYGFVQTYLRGYKQGMTDEALMARGEANIVLGTPLGGPKAESVGTLRGTYENV